MCVCGSMHLCVCPAIAGVNVVCMCVELLIGALGDTGHWGILPKLWILTRTDKTLVRAIKLDMSWLTMPLGLVRHWEDASPCILGAQHGPSLTGPVSSLVVSIPLAYWNNYSFWAEDLADDSHGPLWSTQALSNLLYFRHTVTCTFGNDNQI